MKNRILIENNQSEKAPFRGYKSALRNAVSATLAAEGFSKKAEISISLVSMEQIRELNRDFRGVDRQTDVLSFPLLEKGEEDLGPVAYLGDIVVCPRVIFDQAGLFGTTFRQEMCLMVIHSTLHLLGWDHMEENEKKEMFARQESILASLNEGELKTEE